jgi:hypothetical protein
MKLDQTSQCDRRADLWSFSSPLADVNLWDNSRHVFNMPLFVDFRLSGVAISVPYRPCSKEIGNLVVSPKPKGQSHPLSFRGIGLLLDHLASFIL